MNNQQNTHAEKLIVRQSKSTFTVGLLCTLFFGGFIVLMTVTQNETATLWAYLFFGLLLLIGLCLLWRFIIWQITVEAEEIRVRNFFGKTKMIPFEAIEKIKIDRKSKEPDIAKQILLYSKEGKVILSMEPDCIGLGAFFIRLEQKSIKLE